MGARVHHLKSEQRHAVDPDDSVWLSASAGTGKTQVLAARVLRLLLQPDVRPEQILCLTFTKAGAAEMATRVNEVLAGWVRLDDLALFKELEKIGAATDSATKARARALFASVLDCPGGGLRIETIHAFAQWLLAAFPAEANLVPGTRPMEDRDRELLAHRVLSDLIAGWHETGDSHAIEALEMLSVRWDEQRARAWLMRCAEARAMWFGPGAWQPPMRKRVQRLIGLPNDPEAELAHLCSDGVFDCDALKACDRVLAQWKTKTGQAGSEIIRSWLAMSPVERVAALDSFCGKLFTKDGFETSARKPMQLANLIKRDPGYEEQIARVSASLDRVLEIRTLLGLVEIITPALECGRRFALAWDEAKSREGLLDFDDLIRRAAALLSIPELGGWIRYKLDRQFDHILIDEAQDTNQPQWSIIYALTEEFFSGLGQRDNKMRTIFVVGDTKQAIFRFQGTSPEHFKAARERFKTVMEQNAAAAGQLRGEIEARELVNLNLRKSYRSAHSLLEFVNEAVDAIGHQGFGLDDAPDKHEGDERPGLVTFWRPISAQAGDDDEDAADTAANEDEAQGAQATISQPERVMADAIARQVGAWLADGFALAKGEPRLAEPGDIMILVRKRRELAGLINARLHAAGVPVAGVDRLRLAAPLSVRDLLAALRFAVHPGDDLQLACLLVSPLFGWSQGQLLEHGARPPSMRLWDHLRQSSHPDAATVAEQLRGLLARADYEPPESLLQWLLVGPWRGRQKLVARLGRAHNDPIDELVAAAFSYSALHTPSLTGFIDWFDAGEGELKREIGPGESLVRVMTVHGAKGLQAPIVVLADATGNPDNGHTRGLELEERLPGGGGRKVPLPDLGKPLQVGRIAEAAADAQKAEREEHWRLLYVAMTRAEEALFIGGALGASEKEPAPDSWYARLAPLMGNAWMDDPNWGARVERGTRAPPVARPDPTQPAIPVLPDWAATPPRDEPRPPRPLAPSATGTQDPPDPPFSSGDDPSAARRGVLMHALIERLPDIKPAMREERAGQWLERHGADFSPAERREMLERALAVITEPGWAELFSPESLAEVPLAALVGGEVISGTADRLLVTGSRVLVVDFKTARRPPTRLEQVPNATLRQMSAYAAALAAIYPGRVVEAAVLYTQVPQLIVLPQAVLAAHEPGLSTSGQG